MVFILFLLYSLGMSLVALTSYEMLSIGTKRKRHELWEDQTWMLHHDNAPSHASLLIRSYLAKHQTSVVPHSPYSPDVAPADFFLFPRLQTTLKRRRLETLEEIQENFDNRTARHHRTCVPGIIPTVEETVVSC